MTVLDELLSAGAVYGIRQHDLDTMKKELCAATAVSVQNVSNYLHFTLKQEIFTKDDFSNVAPPFDSMWMEWRHVDKEGIPAAFGVLMHDRGRIGAPVEFAPEAKWRCGASVFVRVEGQPVVFFGGLVYSVDELGRMVKMPSGWDFDAWSVTKPRDIEENKHLAEILHSTMFAPWMALSFMHCKNVVVEAPKPVSLALRRARERKGKPALARFHTIQIEPLRKVMRGSVGVRVDSGGTGRSLHICRGHFSRYGAAYGTKPLFGKYEGCFWVPSHARGSTELGRVEKDYAVNAPPEAQS